MKFELEKPIFPEDSFISPIFNEVFETVLTEISEHLESDIEECYPKSTSDCKIMRKYTPNGADRDDKLVEDTRNIIREIVQINRNLLTQQEFNGSMQFADTPFISRNNLNRLGQIVGQVQTLVANRRKNENQWFRIHMLEHFLKYCLYKIGNEQLVKCNCE